MMTNTRPPHVTESKRCSVKLISYSPGVSFEPSEYGGFIIPTLQPLSCNWCGSSFRKSSLLRLLLPSPRRIMFAAAMVNM